MRRREASRVENDLPIARFVLSRPAAYLRPHERPHERHDPGNPADQRLRREGAAGALRPAGEAVAGRADARRAGRRAGRRPACREKQRKMRVQQLWHWIYVRGATRLRRHDQRVEGSARDAGAALHAGASRGRGRAGVGGRHPQMAAAPARREPASGRTRSSASTSRRPTAARSACRARSAARSPARSATPARSGWCAISPPARSSAR